MVGAYQNTKHKRDKHKTQICFSCASVGFLLCLCQYKFILHQKLCSTKSDRREEEREGREETVQFFAKIYFRQVQTQIPRKYPPSSSGYICFEWSTSVVNGYSHKGLTTGSIELLESLLLLTPCPAMIAEHQFLGGPDNRAAQVLEGDGEQV